jgi:replicative DNA helicase
MGWEKVRTMNYQDGLHYNKTLEQYVIGICILEPSAYDQISPILSSKQFYDSRNSKMFEAIEGLKKEDKVIDLMSVADRCMRHLKLDRTILGELMACTNMVTSSASVMQNAYVLSQMYRMREVIKITYGGIPADIDPMDAINHLEQQLKALRTESIISTMALPDAIMKLYKYQEMVQTQDLMGISTGFKSVDAATSGFVDGGLYVIAARPSVGKSAFMGRNVLGAAMSGKAVGIIQLEMSIEQTVARMSSLYSEIPYQKIITGFRYDESVRDKFYSAMNAMSKYEININPSINLNIEAIKSFSYAMKNKGKLDILFIDYLQLIDQKGGRSREQEVAAISRGLKLLARDLSIPVIALSQLNRGVETRAIKKPVLSDLRESGAIEQDADTVMFIHRDEQVGIEVDEQGNSTKGTAELIIAKNRNGSKMSIPMKFDGERMKFYDNDEYLKSIGI